MRTRTINFNFFGFNFLQNFILACKKIEKNPNYQPYITDEELLALVVGKNGLPVHVPYKSAVAIQPMNVIPLSDDGNSLGALYKIKVAGNDSNYKWKIDSSLVIFVNKKGDISLHYSDNVIKGNLNNPCTNFPINNLLYSECLHYSKKNINQISNF